MYGEVREPFWGLEESLVLLQGPTKFCYWFEYTSCLGESAFLRFTSVLYPVNLWQARAQLWLVHQSYMMSGYKKAVVQMAAFSSGSLSLRAIMKLGWVWVFIPKLYCASLVFINFFFLSRSRPVSSKGLLQFLHIWSSLFWLVGKGDGLFHLVT